MDRSIRRLGVFLMLLFVVLFAQLNYVQVFRADDLNTRTTNSRPVDVTFSQPRGNVSTADGVLLARSVETDTFYQYQREFPEGDLYAHTTGYFNYAFGATGVERAYNEELSGRTPSLQLESVGDLFVQRDRTANVRLTLRSDVQQAARDALGEQQGTVVALDPRSGGVLAQWSFPSFDPNPLSSHDIEASVAVRDLLTEAPGQPLLAKSYREIYPPGSTFKVVTGSVGVESGEVTPTSPTYPEISSLGLPQTNRALPNFGGSSCGGTLFTILARSCNTSFARMGLDIGGPAMIEGAEAFGFNQTLPFDLPAVDSRFPTVDFERELPSLAQSAIGQNDVAATPLQMALVAAGLANDGVIMEPRVLDEVRDGEGEVVERLGPTAWQRATSPETAAIMRDAMREVVATGSATRLQIDGVDVGAKTGTAQFGPGAPLRSHAWVIAWAGPPGEEPEVAVAVIVEGQEGASEQTGGVIAAPIARQVIEAALRPMPDPPPAEDDGDTDADGAGEDADGDADADPSTVEDGD
jgi:peptidoglycan glycosyltransferase